MKNQTLNQAGRFIALVERGITAWQDAGQYLMTCHAENPNILKEITEAAPWIEAATLEMFLQIGEGKIHPKTLLLPPMIANKVAKLPMKQQVELAEKTPKAVRSLMREPGTKHNTNNSGLADKMPTVGFWKITVMNGKAFATKTDHDSRAIPMVLDDTSSCYIQVLSPTAARTTKPPQPEPEEQNLTAVEKEYRKFRSTI